METRWNTSWTDKLANGVAQVRKLLQPSPRGAQIAALDQAYAEFRGCYPAWAQYLFDEYFVRTVAAPLLAQAGVSASFDAASLAEAWARQMNWSSVELRQRHIAALLPAAQYFVRLVRRNQRYGPTRH